MKNNLLQESTKQ